jgi:hypothetical protein
MKRQFESRIQKLILSEDNFIYKSNIELLRLFYNKLYEIFNIEEICNLYLDEFKTISDITQSKIESNFSDLIIEYEMDTFKTDEFINMNESGIYFIYNEIDTLLYIGKTTDLSSRPIQSFINKLPYGSTYMKLIETESDSITVVEAILIDYFLPMYNNKKEIVPGMKNRTYTKVIESFKGLLNDKNAIYPL